MVDEIRLPAHARPLDEPEPSDGWPELFRVAATRDSPLVRGIPGDRLPPPLDLRVGRRFHLRVGRRFRVERTVQQQQALEPAQLSDAAKRG
jgi:hypothetical protein